jgi:hypothetical protein
MVLDLSNVSGFYHTRHGQHLNGIGKRVFTQEVCKIVDNKIGTSVQGFSNQGN